SAPEIADEDTSVPCATPQRGGARHDDVLLMTVHDVGVAEGRERTNVEGISPLTADVPRMANHAHVEWPNFLGAIAIANRHKTGRYVGRHVPSQFERVAFGSSDDAIRTEQCRDEVRDFHRWSFMTSSFTDMNHAGNIQAQRCS